MPKSLALIVLMFAIACPAQERFPSGEFKGFTKSPTEHIIVRMNDPITVSAVRGSVVFQGHGELLKDVTFEIRGPGESGRSRTAKSNNLGRFTISHVPGGAYTFKATKGGYQSVVGILIVSKKANHKTIIRIEMPIGV